GWKRVPWHEAPGDVGQQRSAAQALQLAQGGERAAQQLRLLAVPLQGGQQPAGPLVAVAQDILEGLGLGDQGTNADAAGRRLLAGRLARPTRGWSARRAVAVVLGFGPEGFPPFAL